MYVRLIIKQQNLNEKTEKKTQSMIPKLIAEFLESHWNILYKRWDSR